MLRNLALQVLARAKAGTPAGTPVEQPERAFQAFQQPAPHLSVLERQKPQKSDENEPVFQRSTPREWNGGTLSYPKHAPADCPLYHPRMILAPGECFCDPVPGFDA